MLQTRCVLIIRFDTGIIGRKGLKLLTVSKRDRLWGKDRIKFMEKLTVADLQAMRDNQSTLSVHSAVVSI